MKNRAQLLIFGIVIFFLPACGQMKKELNVHEQGIEYVRRSGVLHRAKKDGDIAPDFTLQDQEDHPVNLKELLSKGPVVLTWYRGGWCPYCNLALDTLQGNLYSVEKMGANLVALSPETQTHALETDAKNHIGYPILHDFNLDVAREYGIVFKLMPEVAQIYREKFGLSKYNGNDSQELPLAATYVIDETGVIRYAFLDVDYKNRVNPYDVLRVLRTLQREREAWENSNKEK